MDEHGRPERMLLSVREAAAVLGIAERTAYDLIRRSDFPVPVLKVGTRMKVSRVMLDRYLVGDV